MCDLFMAEFFNNQKIAFVYYRTFAFCWVHYREKYSRHVNLKTSFSYLFVYDNTQLPSITPYVHDYIFAEKLLAAKFAASLYG